MKIMGNGLSQFCAEMLGSWPLVLRRCTEQNPHETPTLLCWSQTHQETATGNHYSWGGFGPAEPLPTHHPHWKTFDKEKKEIHKKGPKSEADFGCTNCLFDTPPG